MPIYKGFGTSGSTDVAKLHQALDNAAAALKQSAETANAYSHYLDVWRDSHPGKPDDPFLVGKIKAQNAVTAALEQQVIGLEAAISAPHTVSRAEARARDRQALKNLGEPGQNIVTAVVGGGFEGLGEGLGNVGSAVAGVVTGGIGIAADTVSGGIAAVRGVIDEATGNVVDARRQTNIAEAIDKKQLERLQGMTATEDGGWVNSLYQADVLAATGRSDQAIATLAKIPTNELEGLSFNNPNFSKNMAGLGVNALMLAAGAREPLLKEAGALDDEAAILAKSGTKKGITAAARLTKRAEIYRKLAQVPKQAQKPLALVKRVAESPTAVRLKSAASRANRFKNPFKQVTEVLPTEIAVHVAPHATHADEDEDVQTVEFTGPDGKPATGVIVYYDPSISGTFIGPSGKTYEFTGGVKAGTLPGNENLSAAFSRENIASAYFNKLQKTDGYVFFAMRGEGSMLGNEEYWDYYAGETEHALETGKLDPKNLSNAIQDAADNLNIKLPDAGSGTYTLDDARTVLSTMKRRREFLGQLGDGGFVNMCVNRFSVSTSWLPA